MNPKDWQQENQETEAAALEHAAIAPALSFAFGAAVTIGGEQNEKHH